MASKTQTSFCCLPRRQTGETGRRGRQGRQASRQVRDELPVLPAGFEYRLDLANHVTPSLLKDQPIHRWFYFPHSFSPQLVKLLLKHWNIEPGSYVVDPFVGAGTTLSTAQMMGINGIGADLSPLSVFVSITKLRRYDVRRIYAALRAVLSAPDAPACLPVRQAERSQNLESSKSRPERLQRAFTDAELVELDRLRYAIRQQPQPEQDLLLLALIRVQQQISRAIPDGGWFRWVTKPSAENSIAGIFEHMVTQMAGDLLKVYSELDQPDLPACLADLSACLAARQADEAGEAGKAGRAYQSIWKVFRQDARFLHEMESQQPPLQAGTQAIITSPPYPNRHDYSRIFQIELLTLGLEESDIFDLRYNSLRSHVEARSPIVPACLPPGMSGRQEVVLPPFRLPALLSRTIDELPGDADRRIRPMLLGYFEDMNAVLASCFRILAPGGHLALVVGNVRHAGVMVPVDEILVLLGEQMGYEPQISWVARLRGNSAQQMGRYGRMPARESIVILKKNSEPAATE